MQPQLKDTGSHLFIEATSCRTRVITGWATTRGYSFLCTLGSRLRGFSQGAPVFPRTSINFLMEGSMCWRRKSNSSPEICFLLYLLQKIFFMVWGNYCKDSVQYCAEINCENFNFLNVLGLGRWRTFFQRVGEPSKRNVFLENQFYFTHSFSKVSIKVYNINYFSSRAAGVNGFL